MNLKTFPLCASAGLVTGALLLLTSARGAEKDAFPTLDNNYITLGVHGASPSGSKSSFQNVTQTYKSGALGIEEFRYGYDVDKETNVQIDARALAGNEDYLAQVRVTKNEVGTLDVGYRRFRTFYDGAGGFFPANNQWITLFSRDLHVDRGNFFVNATVALPNKPVVTFRYRNQTRNGRKDTTIWGDSDLTGIPIYSQNSLNPVSANRKIAPAYLELGERQETWEATVKHTIGNTTATVSMIGSNIDNLDTRSQDRYPGETKPYPAIPSTPVTLVNPLRANNEQFGFDRQGFKETALTFTGKIETIISDKLTAYAGLTHRHADEDISALRSISVFINTAVGRKDLIGGYNTGQRPAYAYTSTGQLKSDSLTGMIGLRAKPVEDLLVDVGVRAEDLTISGVNNAYYYSNNVSLATGAVTAYNAAANGNTVAISEKPWTPAIDFRFTGIPKVALYGSWDYRSTSQDEQTTYVGLSVNTTTGINSVSAPSVALDKIKEKHSNLKLGANWAPRGIVSARAEVFTKDHENRFEGYGTSAGSYYILYYDTYGARTSVTVKPLPVLSFTTRYVVQYGKVALSEDILAKNDTGDARRHQISETIDWNPNKSVYVQANLNLVYDTIGTSYGKVAGGAADVLHNADNNYWNGNVVTGFVVDKHTDAQVQVSYFEADNFNAALAAKTVPYGYSGRDYSVTAGVKHKFSDRLIGDVKVGYIDSRNDTSGGFSDFNGPVGYVYLTYKL